MEVDVLNLEWMSYSARDRNMSSLVCNYLRYKGFTVVEECIFRGFEMIDKYSPKLLFIANGVGAVINYHIVKYAALKGIKVVTLISEGNFEEEIGNIDQYLWGWNKDHYFYEDINLQWSVRTRNLSLARYPEYKNKIKVSGGCGFDIYKIRPKIQKRDFLQKFGKEIFTKVVGVGCWDFGPCFPGNNRAVYTMPDEVKGRFQKDCDLFNRVLINIISSNPSVLFLLKEHPGNTMGHEMSGIKGSESFDNVLILKNEPIIDTIAVSDFWLTYESTTVMEAWLLGKPTCLLNPTGIDFPRANTYLGSPNYPDEQSLQKAIDSFYGNGSLPQFDDEELSFARRKVIEDTIQWDDGLNHVRAGNEIIKVLNESIEKKRSFIPFEILLPKAKQGLVNTFRIKRSSIYQRSSTFSQDEVQKFSSSLYEDQLCYYKSQGLSKEDLCNILPL